LGGHGEELAAVLTPMTFERIPQLFDLSPFFFEAIFQGDEHKRVGIPHGDPAAFNGTVAHPFHGFVYQGPQSVAFGTSNKHHRNEMLPARDRNRMRLEELDLPAERRPREHISGRWLKVGTKVQHCLDISIHNSPLTGAE
jgi:hypothetical protein